MKGKKEKEGKNELIILFYQQKITRHQQKLRCQLLCYLNKQFPFLLLDIYTTTSTVPRTTGDSYCSWFICLCVITLVA